jgi:membrane-associated phospholipid phosphatase
MGLAAAAWVRSLPVSWYYLGVPLTLVALGAAAFAVDLTVAGWEMCDTLPRDIARILTVVEVAGNGYGVAIILVAVWLLDPANRRRFVGLIAASLGAGMAANVLKLMVARHRPLSAFKPTTVWETFAGWGMSTDRLLQGFPSAHTATAVGLAIALTRLYPRGRWLFLALAFGAGWNRVACGAHYLSDVFFGAAVGFCIAELCAKFGLLPRAAEVSTDGSIASDPRPTAG